MKSEGLTPEQLAERNAQYVTEIFRLEKERAALAAENAGLKAICDDCRRFIMDGVQMGYVKVPTAETDPDLETIRIAISPQKPIPDTDAFRLKYGRRVEMYADNLDNGADDAERGGFDYAVKFLRSEASSVRLFADQLPKEAASEYRHDNNDRYAPKFRSGTSRLALHHVQCGEVGGLCFLKQWGKRRKQERRQKALEAFYDAFELSRIEPGTTAG